MTAGREIRLSIVAATLLAACSGSEAPRAVTAAPLDEGTVCTLDGMLLADYPGPKAQVHFADREGPEFFCDTVEMFHVYLDPEQVRVVTGLFVQDMGSTQWDAPRGSWIDARAAYFVVGSTRRGSMGPTIASFALESAARDFAGVYGGTVLPFAGITPDMVVLDGGALHDTTM